MSIDRSEPGTRVALHQRTGTGIARVGYPIGVRRVRVAAREQVTETMVRLTLSGPELEGFHTYQADDHVKVVFAFPDGTRNDPVPNDEDSLDWVRPVPPTRKYTVRRHDPARHEIDLDFVVHPGGLAADWAAAVAVGDEVVIAGPPGAKVWPTGFDHHVLAVDTTGLPALARWLEESPADVSAHVLIDTDHAADRDYPLASRPGVEVTWLDRGEGSRLAEAVAALTLPPGRTFLFAAGEAGDVKTLRAWAREHCAESMVTGYWKRGVAGLDD
ncbi:siderophore-interacting protein [Nocardioides ochotonae]|uniref:siderophore-interacting protein n=1 Tax=Nocardioides ochotonae TaxID=2685869 RepID=UPI001A9E96CB|nr:siderophore-interacting protein [Nocardioides ochotonae]